RFIDTAPLYGGSEESLGRALRAGDAFAIVTKTPWFGPGGVPANAEALTSAFQASLDRLRQERVYGLLVHRASDLLGPEGDDLFEAMRRLKQLGRVAKIGVSIYDARELEGVLARHQPDLVQLPLNVLDQRLLAGGQITRLKSAGVEIHARSAFLQGLLL